eukprot:CAMPEP_0172305550 /NCGR_PEP_ID=MMETSP1058-20130122/6810_1 /TAXON_ID=83371 /ORGANISM="Detonula confervacea, Strain CCMP 353" /LENGTH=120 /DNA_ID=CAMNT_0013017177 /DNA_START=500 /DNA_END=862 /DNA_ORIENTATION=+
MNHQLGVGTIYAPQKCIDTPKPLNEQLADALVTLRRGGKELDSETDSSEEEDNDGPRRHMDELLDVCDIRCKLGEFKLAGMNYFRCYNAAYRAGTTIPLGGLLCLSHCTPMATGLDEDGQ